MLNLERAFLLVQLSISADC